MYLTDRAGVILRHHTRSSQEGHHSQAHFRHCTPVAVAHHEKFAAEENERGNAPSLSPPVELTLLYCNSSRCKLLGRPSPQRRGGRARRVGSFALGARTNKPI
jgi:hypothetical protein